MEELEQSTCRGELGSKDWQQGENLGLEMVKMGLFFGWKRMERKQRSAVNCSRLSNGDQRPLTANCLFAL